MIRKVATAIGMIALIAFVPGGIPLALAGWYARKRSPLPNRGLTSSPGA